MGIEFVLSDSLLQLIMQSVSLYLSICTNVQESL